MEGLQQMSISRKTEQKSFANDTSSLLPVDDRWEWHMTPLKWSFQTKKLFEQKRTDLMHIFINISLFSTKPGLPFAQCLYFPCTT